MLVEFFTPGDISGAEKILSDIKQQNIMTNDALKMIQDLKAQKNLETINDITSQFPRMPVTNVAKNIEDIRTGNVPRAVDEFGTVLIPEEAPRVRFINIPSEAEDVTRTYPYNIEQRAKKMEELRHKGGGWSDKPSLNDFTASPLDSAETAAQKLLKSRIDDFTGARVYVPLTNEVDDAIQMATSVPRGIEPPLDPFHISGITNPVNVAKLDLVSKNKGLLTSDLVKQSDESIEKLVSENVIKPVEYVRIEGSLINKEFKELASKLTLSDEEIADVLKIVDAKIKAAEKIPMNKNIKEKALESAKLRLLKEELLKRRPC